MTFRDFCAGHGIDAPEDIETRRGKWISCATASSPRKRKGRIKLADDGVAGFAIDYLTMGEMAVWFAGSDKRPVYDHAAAQARIAAREKEEREGTARAWKWRNSATAVLHADHDYLRAKNLTMEGVRGITIDRDGWLVVPMSRDNRLVSVQRISPEGEKRFCFGAPTKGATWRIIRPSPAVTILCEGVATGLTIFQAVPCASVEVCFSASNLVTVAHREWRGSVGVAGDNDHDTEESIGRNPGRLAAEEAARIIGCGYAIPAIIDGSDWNDSFCQRLAEIEESDNEKPYPSGPAKLRQAALAHLRASIMPACRLVSSTTR